MNWKKTVVAGLFFSITGLLSIEPPLRTIAEWRQATASFGKNIGQAAPVSFIDRTIFASDGYPIPCRIFNDQLPAQSPVFVFYPGCAFLFDFFEVNSIIASRIAQKSGIKVVLVQFRLAPEHPVSTCLRDSYDAARHLALHPEEFGMDHGKFFVGGWCSGANAALFVSKTASETGEFIIHHQVLLGGHCDLSHSFHEFDEYEAQDRTVSRQLITHLAHLFYSLDSHKNPLFSPYWNEDFTNYPPTTFLFGEYDALRNDSEACFEKLKAANVPVTKIVLEGQSHNAIVMQDLSSTRPDPTEMIAAVLRKNL